MVKKIDFHIHTVPSIKDSQFIYSSQWIKKYAKTAKLDAIAITNHDLFDKNNFELVKKDIPNVTVFPGMELTLDICHVNIVCSEEQIDDLTNFSNWLRGKHINQTGEISTQELIENFPSWNKAIYIFELGKSNGVKNIPEEFRSTTKIGGVRNALRFQVIKKLEDSITPVLFSDAHATDNDSDPDRNNIDKLKNKNTYIQVDTCNFDEIKNCISDKTKVSITEDNLQDVIEINGHKLSTGLNLVVGKRGTGKTHFLNSIKEQFDSDDIYEIAQFETARADEFIEKQRHEQGEVAVKDWKINYRRQFESINEYLDNLDDLRSDKLEEYIKSVKTFAEGTAKSQSSQKFNLFKEVGYEVKPTKYIEDVLQKLKDLIYSDEIWKLLVTTKQNREIFIETYNELRKIYMNLTLENLMKQEVNSITEIAKEILESNTGIQKVRQIELSTFVEEVQIEKNIFNFLNNVLKETTLRKENIYGYQVNVQLVPFSNANQFQSDLKIKEAVKNDLLDPYSKKDYITFLKNLKKKSFFKADMLGDYLMHKEVNLLDSDGTPASGGQAVGFALMARINEARTKPMILIDEPEASLDNAYIRNELNTALKELARNRMVIVVTHNSTLGTLLEPDYLVVTTKDSNKQYSVLTGEFSSHKISNTLNVTPLIEGSYDKFVEAMESSIEAYNRKGEIYENLRK
ncbi:hypothetical protein ACVR0O_07615 [Streptococcus caviae]|uniref:hypothetical protein n=1 Tax=Streptococcus sp. 'caviae' TaxID=1915004 RepID=UPI00094BBE46|nr:hypothetical protein [Streptococcus sp. 'caviae']OLN82995.1 hypothetical protein BMI76_06980 [Streptococcus sp. 'caviae']